MRDEAHRFAITFHRQKRSKEGLQTELTNIPGIGEKTANQLLSHFKSIKKIRNSPAVEIEEIIGKAKTKKLLSYFEKA